MINKNSQVMKYTLLVLIIIMSLTNCGTKTDFSNPKEVATQFQACLRSGDIQKSFEFLSDSSKQTLTFQDYLDYYDIEYDSILAINTFQISSITQMTIDANFPRYRSFEIKEEVFNNLTRDTTVQYTYLTTINQGEIGWRIIWTKHLEIVGNQFNEKSKFSEAIKVCDQIIEIDPLNGDAFLLKAWLNFRLDNTFELEKNALRGSELAPNNPQSYSALSLLYSVKELPDLAKINLKKAISLSHNPIRKGTLYGNLSIEYMKSNQLDSSIYFLNKSISYDPKNTHAFWQLGTHYYRMKKTDSAFYYFEVALNNPPMNGYLQSQLYFDYANALLHEYNKPESKSDSITQEGLHKAKNLAIKSLELEYYNLEYKALVEKNDKLVNKK